MSWLASWDSLFGAGFRAARWGGSLLLSKDGLGPGDIAARDAQRAGVGELLRGFLHAQAEVGFLQFLDFGLEAGNVFFAQFSNFHFSITPELRADHAADEGGAQRQLGGSQAERLACELFGHANDLEHDLARL